QGCVLSCSPRFRWRTHARAAEIRNPVCSKRLVQIKLACSSSAVHCHPSENARECSVSLDTAVASHGGCVMPRRFCILTVLGDVLDYGELHLVATAKTLKAARRRIEMLARVSPGQYVVYNGQTGEQVFITAGTKPRTYPWSRAKTFPKLDRGTTHSTT